MLPAREPDQPGQSVASPGRPGRAAPAVAGRSALALADVSPAGDYHHCPQCADERPFERPECLDGHGADCPEWACVSCGTAILVAPLTQPDASLDEAERPRPRVVRQAAPGREPEASSRARPAPRPLASARRAPRSLA